MSAVLGCCCQGGLGHSREAWTRSFLRHPYDLSLIAGLSPGVFDCARRRCPASTGPPTESHSYLTGAWRRDPPPKHRAAHIALPTMKVVCAWCLHEGKPGDLGEREPLEDPGVTHSICAGHRDQLLEALPSRSFPDAALLIVVRRNDTALYEHLEWSFAGVPGVKVIVDRRTNDRRSAQDPVSDDRRRGDTRRLRPGRISPVGGYTVVRFTPRCGKDETDRW